MSKPTENPTYDNHILNNPYEEPQFHYATNAGGELNYQDIREGRRIFVSDINVIPSRQGAQQEIFEINDLAGQYETHLVNLLQQQVKALRKGLDDLAKQSTKKKAEATLQIEIDDEAFDRLYGFQSHPFPVQPGQQVAVRVVSQFGEESTKVISN